MEPGAPSTTVGLIVVRGGGAPMVYRRLPRRAPASVGNRAVHAFPLQEEWVPRDLASFTAVDEGWLVVNQSRARMQVENEWVLGGTVVFRPESMVMLQRGDHRLTWSGLGHPLSVSVVIRTRRLDDQKIAYAVDSTVEGQAAGPGHYLGVQDAPMSAALRYRLAVLFRHLIESQPEPLHLVARRAEFLGLPEEELEWIAHKFRRRLNVVRGTDLQSLEELGEYLVLKTEELGRTDLDP